MTIRTLGDAHYLFPQPNHALLAARIAAHLKPEYLGSDGLERWRTMQAIVHHDDGWAAWDADPAQGENGMPLSFLEVGHKVWFDRAEQSIFGTRLRLGDAQGAIVASHFTAFLESHQPDLHTHMVDVVAALRRRVWGEETKPLERAWRALLFSDMLSLLPCTGWLDKTTEKLIGESQDLTLWARQDGDWTVRVWPWPFLVPEIRGLRVDAIRVPVGEEPDAIHILKNPRENAVRLAVDYLPDP